MSPKRSCDVGESGITTLIMFALAGQGDADSHYQGTWIVQGTQSRIMISHGSTEHIHVRFGSPSI